LPSGLFAGTQPGDFITPFGIRSSSCDPATEGAKCTQNYLVAQPGGSVTVTFQTGRSLVSLLWGTVDTAAGQNILTASGFQITGQEVAESCSCTNENVFVLITTDGNSFISYTASDLAGALSAFEFVPARAPEPTTIALLGTGLLGLGLLRRRRT
jgi:hypothetical protein